MSAPPKWLFNQSGVIPYIRTDGDLKIILITNKTTNKWVIPKGIIEEGLSAYESAEKEAFEEAGIRGKVYKKSIGTYEYEKWGGRCIVEVFPCKVKSVDDEWDEMYIRQRKWFPVKKALKKLKNKQLQEILIKYLKNNI